MGKEQQDRERYTVHVSVSVQQVRNLSSLSKDHWTGVFTFLHDFFLFNPPYSEWMARIPLAVWDFDTLLYLSWCKVWEKSLLWWLGVRFWAPARLILESQQKLFSYLLLVLPQRQGTPQVPCRAWPPRGPAFTSAHLPPPKKSIFWGINMGRDKV